jgi:hypothetical protein
VASSSTTSTSLTLPPAPLVLRAIDAPPPTNGPAGTAASKTAGSKIAGSKIAGSKIAGSKIAGSKSTSKTAGSGVTSTPQVSTTPSNSRGDPTVTWSLSGSCQAEGVTYTCHLTLSSSDHLISAGFVTLNLVTASGDHCSNYAALGNDAVTLRGSCAHPPIGPALADYALTPAPSSGEVLAKASFPLNSA